MASVSNAHFGHIPGGQAVRLYTLTNAHGMQASIITYGGILTSLTAPDRHGMYANVVLGHEELPSYLNDRAYFGALTGRYANRIAGGKFSLGGCDYTIPCNEGPNSLHGGHVGFDKVIWHVSGSGVASQGAQLRLHYLSPDGNQGYPGNLSVDAIFTLSEDDALHLQFDAWTDRPTLVNMTNHSYFNLRGHGDVLGHVLEIPTGNHVLPVDAAMIPTGELRPVEGTPFDFRLPISIGQRINTPDEQLRLSGGYDHNWVVAYASRCAASRERQQRSPLPLVARVFEPESGRTLELHSDQPGLQFYSGNQLDGSISGKGGIRYARCSGFCLEPQHFPDSPNKPQFPSTVLKPGETYTNNIIYRFSAR